MERYWKHCWNCEAIERFLYMGCCSTNGGAGDAQWWWWRCCWGGGSGAMEEVSSGRSTKEYAQREKGVRPGHKCPRLNPRKEL